jgi:hypothetical protein
VNFETGFCWPLGHISGSGGCVVFLTWYLNMSFAATPTNEPRAHHFVPRCWLAGFTDSGEKDGRLWVTDLKRRKQWPTKPLNAGHRRDFYRISRGASGDPVVFEKVFSQIENSIAPLFKALDGQPRGPYQHEWESLFVFMAVQWVRVPAFRPTLLRITDRIHSQLLEKALKSPESWAAWMRKLGVATDESGADYDGMVKFVREHHYTLSAETDYFLYRGFKALGGIVSCLEGRYWRAAVSSSGSFIGSDNPVSMDGPKGQDIGFKSADVIVFSASRHVLIYGTNCHVAPVATTRKRIAAHNTFAMLAADEQVYSHVPDFCWLDESGAYQTDWTLFSKEKFEQSDYKGLSLHRADAPRIKFFGK